MDYQTRTPSELGKLEFNYFKAYKIPLDESDAYAIGRKIQSLCNSKAISCKPDDIRIYKELKGDALDVMCDPVSRMAEAANYKKLYEANFGGKKDN